MKVLFTFLLLLSVNFIYAQSYLPMLEDGNTWGVVTYDVYDPTVYYQFSLGENVPINNYIYKRVNVDGSATDCLLREENGKLYFLNTSNVETILLDFTLEVGEVFEHGYFSCLPRCCNLTVVSISSQFIAGQDRKVLEMENNYYNEFWIEGIGSTNGGLCPGRSNIEGGSELHCFRHNGEIILFNNATECFLGVDEYLTNQIILYPNPVKNISILQLPTKAAVDQIKIFNHNGKLVRDEKITKEYVTISNMDYASGLYFYQVFSENKLLKTNKFIVQ
ncbi:putative secreted protein (Por secretion system target) [Ulvibacter sp. MAR_2010_11]|uniref:T9SS type A sorting domain-containing protein n=1 Tax=Ulvibacter sp. MAR_2010_11 TaxID=1250229 RepID=UPI000C2B5900|nr:T9SS type A sorting domain-containing protein [Ulvibacter sp. MAR_2010_11]PKA84042.1 putative secreted protein (Por secretion system target) [Ulvibacter sp. MAR_2010_11]